MAQREVEVRKASRRTVASSEDASASRGQSKDEEKIRRKSQLGQFVIECLKRHGCDVSSESAIKLWLMHGRNGGSSSVREMDAKRLAHTIRKWDIHDPQLAKLREVAEIAGLSMDELTDNHPPKNHSRVETLEDEEISRIGQQWFSRSLEHGHNLSCYLASASRARVVEWKLEAAASKSATAEVKLKIAEGWTKEAKVVEASPAMRRHHDLPNRDVVSHQSIFTLLENRIEWTKAVPRIGSDLARIVRAEVYRAIFEVMASGRQPGFRCYPCRLPEEKVVQTIKSLRVTTDNLVSPRSECHWLVIYHWGPPLDEHDVASILATE